jgi:galactonate dehydratase
MKITKIESMFLEPRWHIIKMYTDEGLVGYGEPIVEGRARTVATCIEEMGSYLIGKDPRQIEQHFQVLYRGTFYRGGPVLTSAISGIDEALWDIKGKALGLRVWQMMGGFVRDTIPVYCWIGGDRPANVGLAAQEHGLHDVGIE